MDATTNDLSSTSSDVPSQAKLNWQLLDAVERNDIRMKIAHANVEFGEVLGQVFRHLFC